MNIIQFIISHPLARRNKGEALKRFFYYQISKLFNPYPIVYTYTDKTKLIVEKEMTGATGNIYCGLHEFEDMAFLLHFLRPDDLFVDIGANVGSYTVLASGQVGAHTIAIEPVPSTFKRLQNNIAINYLDELVTSLNIGIGSKQETLNFTAGLDTVNHVVLESDGSKVISVIVDTLDRLLIEYHPSLIKIDVEGFESEVLRGATNILNDDKLKAIIIELNGSGRKYGFSDEDIHDKLVSMGFTAYTYEPFSRILSKGQNMGGGNTLYLRDVHYVLDRIQSSDQIEIFGIKF